MKKHISIAFEFILFGFYAASKFLRHKTHLAGEKYLKDIPTPALFTITHDSYFEIPSLAKVYFALKPKPDLLIMGKNDFMSGKYLSTNYGQKNRFLRALLLMLDETGLPQAVFRNMKLFTIDRPFVETYQVKKEELKNEITGQMNKFKEGTIQGISTVIFPEGTTRGFGGLKKIRSSVYQLVENTYQRTKRMVYILPINVKVDRLVCGSKDVFIQVGEPVFLRKPREEFNKAVFDTLQRLHTITFSQIAAFYVRRMAETAQDKARTIILEKERFIKNMEDIAADINNLVRDKVLPNVDRELLNRAYLNAKVNRFLKYCVKNHYVQCIRVKNTVAAFRLNAEKVLSSYSAKEYRKLNPLGFCANELSSLGEKTIIAAFEPYLGEGLKT